MSARLVAFAALALALGCGATPVAKPPPAEVSPCHRPAAKQSPPPPSLGRIDYASTLEQLPITKVSVAGTVALESSKVLALSGLGVGTTFTRDVIARAILAIYQSGEIDDVQVRAENGDRGVAITILVRERPFVGAIFADGFADADRDRVAEKLGLATGRRLDIAELQLRAHATDPAVTPAADFEIVPLRDNKVTICLYPRAN